MDNIINGLRLSAAVIVFTAAVYMWLAIGTQLNDAQYSLECSLQNERMLYFGYWR